MIVPWLAVCSDDLSVVARVKRVGSDHGLTVLRDLGRWTVCLPPDARPIVGEAAPFMIFGTLFSGSGHGTGSAIYPKTAQDLVSTGGRSLLGSHWGAYVVLSADPVTQAVCALRDPTGMQPCLWTAVRGGAVLSSSVDLLLAASNTPNSVDLTTLIQTMSFQNLRDSATCIAGVSELLPGMTLTVERENRISVACAWSPWSFVYDSRTRLAYQDAVESVRGAVSQGVRRWQHRSGKILLELSGGIDSSIIAAALAEDQDAIAVTFVARDPEGDERRYARAAAKAAGLELHEIWLDPNAIDVARSSAAGLPRPSTRMFGQHADDAATQIAGEVGTTAFFSGGGGDNVFAHLQSAAPAADLVRLGNHRGAARTMRNIALANRADMGTILRRTLRIALRHNPRIRWQGDFRYLSVTDVALSTNHPWLEAPIGALPGAQARVASLIRTQNHVDGHARTAFAPVMFPLLAQPVVEACLAVPSWMWLEGGLDRSIARSAFAAELPAIIATRRTKGGFDGFTRAIFTTHRMALRDMILGGRLAAAGIIDRDQLAPLFAEGAILPDYRLLMLGDVEAWLGARAGGASVMP
jgi:asparagine synthase (glutamine-hydrolysing)